MLQTSDGVVIRVYVQPKARREQLVGMYGDRLKTCLIRARSCELIGARCP
jgi:uncharacterized protein YggU (UPF0235/DUF167 family)